MTDIHFTFQGKDLSLRCYLHPDQADKSSLSGKPCYEITVTRAQWQAAKQSLIANGHLNKAGAITVKGNNAL